MQYLIISLKFYDVCESTNDKCIRMSSASFSLENTLEENLHGINLISRLLTYTQGASNKIYEIKCIPYQKQLFALNSDLYYFIQYSNTLS